MCKSTYRNQLYIFGLIFCLADQKQNPCVFVGDLPQGVRGGPVRRLREYESGPVRCAQHTIWYKVWIRSQGLWSVDFVYFVKTKTLDTYSLLFNTRSLWGSDTNKWFSFVWQLEDTLWAGLTDLHIKIPMGITAENLAEKYQITREEVDNYAYQSQQKWKAGKTGFFKEKSIF